MKKLIALLLTVLIVCALSGCKSEKVTRYETPDTVSTSNNTNHTGAKGKINLESQAKELVSDYIYINGLGYTIYEDQDGKLNSNIIKKGYYYYAIEDNATNKQCEKSFAVKIKDSTIWAVDNSNGKMTLAFNDELFGN